MAYVQVPKDLSKVKTKVLFSLTRRQLLCFTLAGIVGIPFYLLTKGILGTTLSAMIMILIILPFFLLAMYEKDGRPLEKVIWDIIQARIIRPGIRVYRTENLYRWIHDQIYEREVLGLDRQNDRKNDRATG
ncbi:MAG: PrgI family protein [Eubacterium sp.]|nr:PrgI family protein [Eubacterium sp.]